MRSASARAAATASSRSRRARRRSSSAARCDSAARCSAARARSSASRVARSAARIEASVSSNACWPSLRRERASATIARGQPEPLGDGEGLAAAGQADPEVIGRRERLEVELDGGVPHVGGRVGVDLQLGVVGGGGHQRAGPQEVVEQGLGQGRALGRVRARAELVEEDERGGAGGGRDPHDRAQVAGEGREALGDALLVPDVGEEVAPAPGGGCPGRRGRGARPGA